MKRFLLIILPLIVFAFAFFVDDLMLNEIFNCNSESATKRVDLGFVIEEYYGENYRQYKDGERVVGEVVQIEASKLKLNEICDKLSLNITNKYKVEDTLIIEGVSPRIKYSTVDNQANVQIALINSVVTIGVPIIYGSF